MAKRVRSPNYPSISLAAAVERLTRLGDAIHTHPASHADVLTGMGYSGANGASLMALSAMGKYGLVARENDEYRIAQRGIVILHPENNEEREKAIREAADAPKVFSALTERYPGGKVNDDVIRNYLVRNGFSLTAAASALLSYRETMAFVENECVGYDSGDVEPDMESPPVDISSTPSPSAHGKHSPATPTNVAPPGKFRVSMTDEFFVDVSAVGLNRSGVKRLVAWLQANKELVPDDEPISDNGNTALTQGILKMN